MSPLTESNVLRFIQEELGVVSYTSAVLPFQEHEIGSFQVLEILLEIERQEHKKFTIKDMKPDAFTSLKALLDNCS